MNNKGQALIEFILILPIFLIIFFLIYDFGNILTNKNSLENKSTDIIELYKNGEEIEQIQKEYQDITINKTSYKDKYTKITITKKINILTPGLNKIIGNPYQIKIERIIYAS